MEYKAGQQVMATRNLGLCLTRGKIYIVKSVELPFLRVKSDLGRIDGFTHCNFKIVDAADIAGAV